MYNYFMKVTDSELLRVKMLCQLMIWVRIQIKKPCIFAKLKYLN